MKSLENAVSQGTKAQFEYKNIKLTEAFNPKKTFTEQYIVLVVKPKVFYMLVQCSLSDINEPCTALQYSGGGGDAPVQSQVNFFTSTPS